MKETPYSKYKKVLKLLELRLSLVQKTCSHPEEFLNKEYKADTGNWCKDDDKYWISYKCDYCGKYWNEDQ